MGSLEDSIKRVARESGAAVVGISSRERLSDAPPSGDAGYILPETRSVISVAVPLNRKISRDFLSKKDWYSHCEERKQLVRTVYGIMDRIFEFLNDKGFEAKEVDVNNNFRPEPGAADITEMTEFLPVFSHRYAAVAAGVGRLGWSGNVLNPEYGAMLELGTVLTSAELEPDPPMEDNPCDKCKLCTASCPVGMISKSDTKQVTVAGITDEIAVKKPNTCCWIGCTGYHGLSADRKWSNWSPYRLDIPLPQDKAGLDSLNIRLQKADPLMQIEDSSFSDYRKAMFRPDWFTNTVCGNCRHVCWKDREERQTNLKLLRNSGVVALGINGEHIVTTEDKVVEVKTPFLVNVAVLKSEYPFSTGSFNEDKIVPVLPPIDAAVVKMFSNRM